jgi:hypothetical protein
MASKEYRPGTPPRYVVLDSEAHCRFGEIAKNVAVTASHFERIVPFARQNHIDLAIMGPDDPDPRLPPYYASSPPKSLVDMVVCVVSVFPLVPACVLWALNNLTDL